MKHIYLVDSENVADSWLTLLDLIDTEDEILLFYTLKTPYMNYESLRRLKESSREIQFVKCCEGANALDFQLVTELGYRLHECGDTKFTIVTNDNGFDAVVRYWTERGFSVDRITGKQCKEQSSRLLSALQEGGEETADACRTGAEEGSMQEPDKEPAINYTEIRTILSCITMERMDSVHNALELIYGEAGKEIYQKIKSGEISVKLHRWNQQEKFKKYCGIVLTHSDLPKPYPKDLSSFLLGEPEKRKNLNSLRAALQSKYGKEKGMKYYAELKAHIKIMNRL